MCNYAKQVPMSTTALPCIQVFMDFSYAWWQFRQHSRSWLCPANAPRAAMPTLIRKTHFFSLLEPHSVACASNSWGTLQCALIAGSSLLLSHTHHSPSWVSSTIPSFYPGSYPHFLLFKNNQKHIQKACPQVQEGVKQPLISQLPRCNQSPPTAHTPW